MITNFTNIEELFKQIDKVLNRKIAICIIGGAVLLYQDLKDATKDIDIVVRTKTEFIYLQKALEHLGFATKIPEKEYIHFNLNQIFIKDNFRIDLFEKEVCGRFSLSETMIERGKIIIDLRHVKLALCTNEDVFLFKTMTEREGDIDDCLQLLKRGLNWSIIIDELKNQIKQSKQDVWITWVGERLDILESRGLVIPIMNEFNKLREEYFNEYEKKHSS